MFCNTFYTTEPEKDMKIKVFSTKHKKILVINFSTISQVHKHRKHDSKSSSVVRNDQNTADEEPQKR
jgi:hypothetical protein